jgi:hypothetical protein
MLIHEFISLIDNEILLNESLFFMVLAWESVIEINKHVYVPVSYI